MQRVVASKAFHVAVFRGVRLGHLARMVEIDGVSYGAFIVPGMIMLSLLTQSIANAPRSASICRGFPTPSTKSIPRPSRSRDRHGLCGAAASKSILGLIMLATARLFVSFEVATFWMLGLLVLRTAVTFSCSASSSACGPTASRSCRSFR